MMSSVVTTIVVALASLITLLIGVIYGKKKQEREHENNIKQAMKARERATRERIDKANHEIEQARIRITAIDNTSRRADEVRKRAKQATDKFRKYRAKNYRR